MYSEDFKRAVKFIFKWEGGYSNDKNDPGGETNFGISKRAYPNEDIKNMTRDRAEKIYYENYWIKSGCDKLPEPLNIVVFDTAVNMGRSRAKKFLKECWGWEDFLLRRLYTYSKFKLAKLYFRGWSNRVLDLYNQIRKEGK